MAREWSDFHNPSETVKTMNIPITPLVDDVDRAFDGVFDLGKKWAKVASVFAEYGIIVNLHGIKVTDTEVSIVTENGLSLTHYKNHWIVGNDNLGYNVFFREKGTMVAAKA